MKVLMKASIYYNKRYVWEAPKTISRNKPLPFDQANNNKTLEKTT
jgi:hypothetical protein